MRIKEKLRQHRRDFIAIYECEHCGFTKKEEGYDDANFHQNVIPKFECDNCGKTADEDYQALPTRYPEGYQI
ncbi:hypothetical protein [Mammaliicoccus sp. D-M17]|uniref:hypothetical protein n=1 Tax=Mammaliicoccus sp. D-M17 TaxID=2898677 RepID=UPI001EFB5E46|nr:hypothetical protein [Mammaliicoccus sp. D-M17]